MSGGAKMMKIHSKQHLTGKSLDDNIKRVGDNIFIYFSSEIRMLL